MPSSVRRYAAWVFAKAEFRRHSRCEVRRRGGRPARSGDGYGRWHIQPDVGDRQTKRGGFEQCSIITSCAVRRERSLAGNDCAINAFQSVGEGFGPAREFAVRGRRLRWHQRNTFSGAARRTRFDFRTREPLDISDHHPTSVTSLILQPAGAASRIGPAVRRPSCDPTPKDNARDARPSSEFSESMPRKIPDITVPKTTAPQPIDDDDGALQHPSRNVRASASRAFAGVALGDGIQTRRARRHIKRERDQKKQYRGNARLHMDRVEKEPVEGA